MKDTKYFKTKVKPREAKSNGDLAFVVARFARCRSLGGYWEKDGRAFGLAEHCSTCPKDWEFAVGKCRDFGCPKGECATTTGYKEFASYPFNIGTKLLLFYQKMINSLYYVYS